MLLYLKHELRLSCCNHRKHHGHLGVKSDAFRSANCKKNTTYTSVNGAIIKYRLKAKKQRLYITSFPLS